MRPLSRSSLPPRVLPPRVGLAAIALLSAVAAGCASTGDGAAAPTTAKERGYAIAQSQCSRCHAVGVSGESPFGRAPPFRDIGRRNNPLAFERRLKEIERGEHPDMPPTLLAPNDASDLGAYIASLGG